MVLNKDMNKNSIITMKKIAIKKWLMLMVKLMKLDMTIKIVMPMEGITIAASM